jgi:hypothetical protein
MLEEGRAFHFDAYVIHHVVARKAVDLAALHVHGKSVIRLLQMCRHASTLLAANKWTCERYIQSQQRALAAPEANGHFLLHDSLARQSLQPCSVDKFQHSTVIILPGG